MKQTLLVIFFFLPYLIVFGQNEKVDIDKLETTENVEALIHSFDKKYKKFKLKKIGEFTGDDFCKRISDSLSITKAFYKSDFDNNGLTDILAIGNYYDFNIMVVMNFGKDSLKLNRLTRRAFQDCVFPKIINDTIIDLYYETQQSWTNKEKPRLVKKSLIYKFGDFIELNENPIDNRIEKIEFKTTMCYGTCPKFQLVINQDKTSIFIAENHNRKTRKSKEIEGRFTSNINDKSFQQLVNLLNYINFPELKDQYSVNWTDDQTSTLRITYDNGKIKEIRDYGLIGTYGLDKLYELLFDLRFNQNWK